MISEANWSSISKKDSFYQFSFYENFLILHVDYALIKGNEMKKVMTIKIISMLLFMIPLTTSSAHHHTTKDAKHEKIKKDDGDTQDDKVVKTNHRSRTNQEARSDSKQRKNT